MATENTQHSILDLNVIQPAIAWHDPDSNFKTVSDYITELPGCDLIILPEMWSSGFTMYAHRFHDRTTEALELMQSWAVEKEAVVIGSLITKVSDFYYNRAYIVRADGSYVTYDKRHLFGFAGEDRVFQAGKKQLTISVKSWKICVNICYDLRFPVWARNTMGYDMLVYLANWPDKRITAWNTLLRARAIENQSYVIGANCYGRDAWDNAYSGHSAIISPVGEDIATLDGKAGVISARLDINDQNDIRAKFPFLKDRDSFSLDGV